MERYSIVVAGSDPKRPDREPGIKRVEHLLGRPKPLRVYPGKAFELREYLLDDSQVQMVRKGMTDYEFVVIQHGINGDADVQLRALREEAATLRTHVSDLQTQLQRERQKDPNGIEHELAALRSRLVLTEQERDSRRAYVEQLEAENAQLKERVVVEEKSAEILKQYSDELGQKNAELQTLRSQLQTAAWEVIRLKKSERTRENLTDEYSSPSRIRRGNERVNHTDREWEQYILLGIEHLGARADYQQVALYLVEKRLAHASDYTTADSPVIRGIKRLEQKGLIEQQDTIYRILRDH